MRKREAPIARLKPEYEDWYNEVEGARSFFRIDLDRPVVVDGFRRVNGMDLAHVRQDTICAYVPLRFITEWEG